MPDLAGVLNTEVRLPLAEGPGFLAGAFVEREDEATVAIGVYKENGVYAYARISIEQFRDLVALVGYQPGSPPCR